MTDWERLLSQQPNRAPFTIAMDGNTINEVWTDLDTKLKQNQGWHVVGVEYTFEGIDPTNPTLYAEAIHRVETLQVQRGTDSEILLPAFHPDTLLHHSVATMFDTSGLAMGPMHPIKVQCDEFTRHNKLRVLFRSRNDNTGISDPAIQLTGILKYHIISAPDDGRTKLGIDIDEI